MGKAQFNLFSIPKDIPERISLKVLDQILANKDIPSEVSYSLSKHIHYWKFLNNEIKELDTIPKKRSESDPLFKIYESIPGFGIITASILSTELGDLSQFPNRNKQVLGET